MYLSPNIRLVLIMLTVLVLPTVHAQTPPTFQLPTFKNTKPDFKAPQAPIIPDPYIDTLSIYNAVLSCYPTPSRFELSTRTAETDPIFQNPENFGEKLGIGTKGQYYFDVVGHMPLIDDSETIDRQRKREYDRRKDTAALVASFTKAIAKRNQAQREIGLYIALERRSQIRVQKGVASVTEQIGHLESVIKAQKKLTEATAEILQVRLSLSGQCQTDYQHALDSYLQQIAQWQP